MALRAAKANEDAMQPVWGQRFGAAAELPLGAERYVSVGSAGDLAGVYKPRLQRNSTVFAKMFPARSGLFADTYRATTGRKCCSNGSDAVAGSRHAFFLLIPEHPEKVDNISGYHRVPNENGDAARGHDLIDRPEHKRRRQKQPL